MVWSTVRRPGRRALIRLLHRARQTGAAAIAVEYLDFSAEKTREKHGRRKRFRQLISGLPTGKLRARLVSMSDRPGRPACPRARGTPSPRPRTTDTIRAAGRGANAGDQDPQNRSGCPQ
jgi:hypothetical protein